MLSRRSVQQRTGKIQVVTCDRDVVVTYLHDEAGAQETRRRVEAVGRRAVVVHFDQHHPS